MKYLKKYDIPYFYYMPSIIMVNVISPERDINMDPTYFNKPIGEYYL